MNQTDTLLTKPLLKADRTVSHSLVCLIEVPEVKLAAKRNSQIDALGRHERQGRPFKRPRRRLRRRVRVAGCALLTLAPLISLCAFGWSERPGRVLACSIAPIPTSDSGRDRGDERTHGDASGVAPEAPADPSAIVVLSVGPAPTTQVAETDVSVKIPGYVLPDDSIEDSTHEGS